MSRIKKVRHRLESLPAQLNRFRPLSLAVVRLTLAGAFIPAGWTKLGALDRTSDFFRTLDIPMPVAMAALVGFVELAGGVLILAGLAARYASIALILTLTFAIRLAKWEEVTGPLSLIELGEFLYMVLCFALLTIGSGAWSLDAILSKNRKERELA